MKGYTAMLTAALFLLPTVAAQAYEEPDTLRWRESELYEVPLGVVSIHNHEGTAVFREVSKDDDSQVVEVTCILPKSLMEDFCDFHLLVDGGTTHGN